MASMGVVEPPPWAWGWFDHPRPAMGVAPTTPLAKMGWPGHPILAKGVVGATPDFHLFFFSFFFFFDFHLFNI
jgi:hypothetical protein